jgi:hypothetical protein
MLQHIIQAGWAVESRVMLCRTTACQYVPHLSVHNPLSLLATFCHSAYGVPHTFLLLLLPLLLLQACFLMATRCCCRAA